MSRRVIVGVAAGVLVVAAALVAWRVSAKRSTASSDAGKATAAHVRRTTQRWIAKGAIVGTVRDDKGAAIEGARVCAAAAFGVPQCAQTAASGAYEIAGLFPLAYEISASAPKLRAAVHGGKRPTMIVLGESERRTGIDLVLGAGAVALTGTVADINGGPIVHARVRAKAPVRDDSPHWYPAIETDAAGAFTLWVAPGDTDLEVAADGYAVASVDALAPGEVSILMTPEGTLRGTVVDAAGTPVEGAIVLADYIDVHERTRSAADGSFRFTGLVPARYELQAYAEQGYGQSEGSVAVALGSETSGIKIQLVKAARVTARVETEAGTLCDGATAKLHDGYHYRDVFMTQLPDGTFEALGVLPAMYQPVAHCPGHIDNYELPRVVVGTEDKSVVWQFKRGATIHGVVRSSGGAPIESVRVAAKVGEDRFAPSFDGQTDASGAYEITGVPPGSYTLTATTPREGRASQPLTIEGTMNVERDLVVDDGSEIRGVVVDTDGRAAAGLEVRADPGAGSDVLATSGSDGTFSLAVRPGTYSVVAGENYKTPLSDPTSVTVAAAQTATVRLVVPPHTRSIRGTVTDSSGAPVADAFVTASVSSGWGDLIVQITTNSHPTLTAPDGSFTISGLGEGTYVVDAVRRGGGEARKKDVASGSTVQLVIAATATLSGTVSYADGGHPEHMRITVRDDKREYFRDETFFHTGGAFTLPDLVAGTLDVAVRTDDGLGTMQVTLAPGEHKRDVAITLERAVTVRGRAVDAISHEALPGYMVSVNNKRELVRQVLDASDLQRQTGPDGRFTVLAPRGDNEIEIHSTRFFMDRTTCSLPINRTVTADTDLGDISIVRARNGTAAAAPLGFQLGTGDKKLEVTSVDAKGPAAASLHVGDTITSIDGISGELLGRCVKSVLLVAPGTTVHLGLARGTVDVTTRP